VLNALRCWRECGAAVGAKKPAPVQARCAVPSIVSRVEGTTIERERAVSRPAQSIGPVNSGPPFAGR
jgi:hypothetical protein